MRTAFLRAACLVAVLFCVAGCSTVGVTPRDRVVVAYVTSWSKVTPDPSLVTHINYAFGHVNKTFDGVRIDNPARLQSIAALKRRNPRLKVLLSVGGWGSGGFSEMAASPWRRASFARSCRDAVARYGLDGIDIDWEYPGINAAGISSSPRDTEHFSLLMRDLRSALGANRLLTLASANNAGHVDFREVAPVVDFVNIMAYDMANVPKHHAALFASPNAGQTADASVNAHLRAGIPACKLVLGMPFYGHGVKPVSGFLDYSEVIRLRGYARRWDAAAKVPYLVDGRGRIVCCYDDPASLQMKCEYIKARGLLGGMYWDYAGDDSRGTLRRTVYSALRR
jgi:chitinase